MSFTADPRSLPEHDYYECGEQIAQRYREGKPLRAKATLYAWWSLSDDEKHAVHRVCCGESWTNLADLAVMQDFEASAQDVLKTMKKPKGADGTAALAGGTVQPF